jgi:signal transduction histidine kinase
VEQRGVNSFWWFATAWLVAFGVYLIALAVGGPHQAETIHNVGWTLAPVLASVACWSTARSAALSPAQRRAWKTMALACASWLIGQLIWDYYAFAPQAEPAFPGPSKVFYLVYAALMVRALGGLSDSSAPARFAIQHLGDLGLIGCCLAVTLVITFLEPALQTTPNVAIVGSLVHSTLVATTFFAALYYLWTRRWHATWAPMLLIVIATGIYALGNFIYVHALMMATYRPTDWVNLTWIVMFLMIGLAANLRATVQRSPPDASTLDLMSRRSRLLEAMIPALLIIMMILVGMSVATQLSPRVLVTAAVLLLAFALILGAREAWIQGESQRLTLELRNTNERLRGAHTGLQDSEARVRDLNAHLEERIAERTRQLQVAYEELEGFAYAVAHDLKAPLRAIDGFGHLLDASLQDRADERTSAYLVRIRRSAAKMAALIDDLLAYSRIERRALVEQSIDLKQLIDAVAGEYTVEINTRGVELTQDVPSITLSADPEGVALIVRNLLQNALKFTRTAPAPRIDIIARTLSSHIEVVVRDNGIGFDMQYHDQIFRLFHRLHRDDQYAGTGIGLALVSKALERMRGSVRAESKEGQGATFIVRLASSSP